MYAIYSSLYIHGLHAHVRRQQGGLIGDDKVPSIRTHHTCYSLTYIHVHISTGRILTWTGTTEIMAGEDKVRSIKASDPGSNWHCPSSRGMRDEGVPLKPTLMCVYVYVHYVCVHVYGTEHQATELTRSAVLLTLNFYTYIYAFVLLVPSPEQKLRSQYSRRCSQVPVLQRFNFCLYVHAFNTFSGT